MNFSSIQKRHSLLDAFFIYKKYRLKETSITTFKIQLLFIRGNVVPKT